MLVRNPNYKGSRPANPDQIVFTTNTDQNQSLLQVKAGQVDYDLGGRPGRANAPLAERVRRQQEPLLRRTRSCVTYLALNTARAPFATLNARKAVNWAIDRPALLRLRGKFGGKRTDQILVPGISRATRTSNLYAIKGANPAKAKAVAAAAATVTSCTLPLDSCGRTAPRSSSTT